MKKATFLILILYVSSALLYGQKYEIHKGDTINYIDNNVKEGRWILFFPDTKEIHKEGEYQKGKKQGLWTTYYLKGGKKSEITYVQGEKKGYAKIYFKNGNIAEEGTWIKDRWVGKYKSYFENGKLSYAWNYNDKGSRCGYQQYFYENGKIKIEGEWLDGKEKGIIREYYATGHLKCEKDFSEGKLDTEKIKVFKQEEKIKIDLDTNMISENVLVIDSVQTEKNLKEDTIKVFKGNGWYVFYNKFKKKEKEGYFVNGVLMEGRQFIYDEAGQLKQTYNYKEGKIVNVVNDK